MTQRPTNWVVVIVIINLKSSVFQSAKRKRKRKFSCSPKKKTMFALDLFLVCHINIPDTLKYKCSSKTAAKRVTDLNQLLPHPTPTLTTQTRSGVAKKESAKIILTTQFAQ